MSELALLLVRIGFVAVLWIFIFSLLSVIRADIYGRRVIRSVAQQSGSNVASQVGTDSDPDVISEVEAESGGPSHLYVITGVSAGTKIPLDKRELFIGRAPSCELIVTDEFASSQHAKVVHIGGDWVIQDLDSTNGTYVDGARIQTPEVLRMNIPVRVGKTTFELRP
ncbi:MAG TPA: FHA domain-containing protein [Microbacteriaceae bacterium]